MYNMRQWFIFSIGLLSVASASTTEAMAQDILNNIAGAKRQYREDYMPPNPTGYLSSFLAGARPAYGSQSGNDHVSAQSGFNVNPVEGQEAQDSGFNWLR